MSGCHDRHPGISVGNQKKGKSREACEEGEKGKIKERSEDSAREAGVLGERRSGAKKKKKRKTKKYFLFNNQQITRKP